MERINKMIRKTITEIVFVIALVFISIPIWKSFNLEKYESVAMYYDNFEAAPINVTNLDNYVLYKTPDDVAIANIKPIIIEFSNNKQDYNINLVVDKNSTLNYQNIKIYYNNEVKHLKELNIEEDEYNYYFQLEVNNNMNKELIMWIDSDSDDDIKDKYLSFDIINNTSHFL